MISYLIQIVFNSHWIIIKEYCMGPRGCELLLTQFIGPRLHDTQVNYYLFEQRLICENKWKLYSSLISAVWVLYL
jgi:hypothetical protein